MSFVDSDEQRLLREAVRDLARKYGHRDYLEVSRSGRTADELWSELARYGYVGVNIPAEYGGAGAGVTELAIVEEELAAAGTPSFLLIVSAAICGELLVHHGTREQKREWLPRMAAGEAKMAFAVTESDAGTNTHRVATTATFDGGGYRLRGAKVFASAVEEADRVVVVARTSTDERTGRGRLSLFLVDPRADGVDRQLISVEMTAPEKQWSLFFDDVALGPEALIGVEGEGLRALFSGLNPERILSAATSSARTKGSGLEPPFQPMTCCSLLKKPRPPCSAAVPAPTTRPGRRMTRLNGLPASKASNALSASTLPRA